MANRRVDINEVRKVLEKLREFNSLNLDEVDFYDGDKKLEIDATHKEHCHHYGITVPVFIKMFIK